MDKAVDLSIQNVLQQNGGPFGAVIVKDNVIIAEGVNSVTKLCDPTAHAEIVAIRKACKVLNTIDLSECVIFSSCEPCPMCYSAIKWSRIAKIYYSNTREEAHNIGFSDKEIYDEIINGNETKMNKLKHSKSLLAFELWSNDNNKAPY